jgi:LAO/AO transport system kinase
VSDLDALIEQARSGNRRALSRLITLVEQGEDSAESVITRIYPFTGNAHIVGVTGSPGAGKSSLVNELAKQIRKQDKRVGIIAVDPSSPFSGGALLGDRIRMRDLYGDKGIFIRSMASRGRLGGLAQGTGAVAKVMDAAGYDVILIETVGAGQAEVDIAGTAHTTLVVEAPGMGDDIQTIKAGILEIADILIVNKADKPGKDGTVKALQAMLRLGHSTRVLHHGIVVDVAGVDDVQPAAYWQTPVVETVATTGSGIVELSERIDAHHAFLHETGLWFESEKARSRQEIEQLLTMRFIKQLTRSIPQSERDALITAVARREQDPYSAVSSLLKRVGSTHA